MNSHKLLKNLAITIAMSACLATSFSAQAGTITDLYNTSVSSIAGTQDQNYTVTDPDGFTNNGYTNQSPIPQYIANTSTSGWLTNSNNATESFPTATYNWKTTFNLTGFNAASASFSGQFAADDTAIVYLNGTEIGQSDTAFSYASWTSFASQPGLFVAGLNTLEFQVTNGGAGPTGLQVQFLASSETAVSAVPEPESYAMLLTGLGLMGFMVRRRKTS